MNEFEDFGMDVAAFTEAHIGDVPVYDGGPAYGSVEPEEEQ